MDPMASLKTYWSLLKILLNNKKVLVFLLYFKTTNTQEFSIRKQNYLTCSLLSNVLR